MDSDQFEVACLRAVQRDAVTIDRLRLDLERVRREVSRLERVVSAKDETIAALMGVAAVDRW